ncbi:MAG: hypothetical protein ABW191_05935 [Aliihoeflea sp.]
MPGNWEIGLEVVKLLVGASVPAILAYLGLALNKRLKSIDQAQWQNRKIIEIRLDIYKDISPKLNSMFCFCMWIGDWKYTSPADMVNLKRSTDKTVNVYRHLLTEGFYASYDNFVQSVFQTFNGPGEDAKIRSPIISTDGDRRAAFKGQWEATWNTMFASGAPTPKEEISQNCNIMMNEFRACIGLKEAELK